MSLLDKIKQLCKERGVSISQLEERLNIPSNTIYQWKKKTPSIERVKKVADYFQVSIDYLLDRTDEKDENEEQIITMFRKNTAGMTKDEKDKFNRSLNKLMAVAKTLLDEDDE